MDFKVVFLSKDLSLSGSTTWLLCMIKAFQEQGIPCVHIIAGKERKIKSQANYHYYTQQPRSLFKFKLMRSLQVHKIFNKSYKAQEDKFYSMQVASILNEKLDRKVLVIKDFSTDLPSYFKDDKFTVVSVLHHQYREIVTDQYYNKLIAVSDEIKKESNNIGYNVDQTIYNPVYTSDIVSKSKNYTVKEENYLIFVGRLHREKGVYELIEAYRQLVDEEQIEHKLLFVGEGKARQELEEYSLKNNLNQQVVFKGFLANPYPYIEKASLLILPSYSEAMGYVAIEASILETPYLVADYPAAKEFFLASNIFAKGETKSQFIQALKNKIIEVLQSEKSELRDGVLEKMQPDLVAKEYIKFYKP